MSKEGDVLAGRYVLGPELGSGAMGSVFRARDERLGGEVAVKVLHEDVANDPGIVDRLRREARAAAGLGSPHIVRVSDFQEEPPFLVMEKIDGPSLAEVVTRTGALPAVRACTIAMQVLAALEVAHAAGIVHRDMKPENVLLAASPTGDLVKVCDFGLAHQVAELASSREIVGTFSFVAPEHLAGGDAGPRADLYAVGALLFFMLGGRRPFEGLSVGQWILVAQVNSPRLDDEGVPAALASLVARAMAIDPAQRFATARDMLDALRPWCTPRPMPEAPEVIRRPQADPVSPILSRLVLIGIVLALVLVMLFVAKQRRRGALAPAPPAVATGRR